MWFQRNAIRLDGLSWWSDMVIKIWFYEKMGINTSLHLEKNMSFTWNYRFFSYKNQHMTTFFGRTICPYEVFGHSNISFWTSKNYSEWFFGRTGGQAKSKFLHPCPLSPIWQQRQWVRHFAFFRKKNQAKFMEINRIQKFTRIHGNYKIQAKFSTNCFLRSVNAELYTNRMKHQQIRGNEVDSFGCRMLRKIPSVILLNSR